MIFWQLTRLAPFVAHKQKIYQNVRLNLTRYAIIQIFRMSIFRVVRRKKLPNLSHKKWMGWGKKKSQIFNIFQTSPALAYVDLETPFKLWNVQ